MRRISCVFQALLVIAFISVLPGIVISQTVSTGQQQERHGNQPDQEIKRILETTLKEKPLPGIVAAIAKEGEAIRAAAAGIRKYETDKPLTIDDQLHLGSCTKAITATLIARMVERGDFSWDTTIKQGLPEVSKKIHPAYQDVTLKQLVMHYGGMPANAKNWFLKGGENLTARRELIVIDSLSSEPKKKPGTQFVYSNLGYMIAGLIAAKSSGKPWEQLIQEEVFDQLGLSTAGFGPPGTLGKIEQPWGHIPVAGNKFLPLQRDNAPALGPAGTVHMSIGDWARFALAHTRTEGSEFLSSDSLSDLHQPDSKSKYAKGWIVAHRGWGKGTVLTHGGSNTMWLATVWLAPKTKTAYLVVANAAGPSADEVVRGLFGKLIELDLKEK